MHENDFTECPSPPSFPLPQFSFFLLDWSTVTQVKVLDGSQGLRGYKRKLSGFILFDNMMSFCTCCCKQPATAGILQLSIALSAAGLFLITVWFASEGDEAQNKSQITSGLCCLAPLWEEPALGHSKTLLLSLQTSLTLASLQNNFKFRLSNEMQMFSWQKSMHDATEF